MKKLFAVAALFMLPLTLVGCQQDKVSNNFFSTNIETIAHDGEAAVRLWDPNYNYKYSIEFIPEKLFDNIVLGGGLAGKKVGDTIAVSEDKHSITIALSGKATNMTATEGTITINPGAIKALNSEYVGFKFVNKFTMADTTKYKLS